MRNQTEERGREKREEGEGKGKWREKAELLRTKKN
jgi:hypothetical protein